MASFLILTPPAGPDRDHRSTRFIEDGLSMSAFFFPWIWFFSRGLWLWGVAAVVAQGVGAQCIANDALAPAGLALLLTTSLFAALEGKRLEAVQLQKNGWTLEDLLLAPDLGTAEAMYFSALPAPAAPTMPATADWVADKRGAPKSTFGAHGPALGLFDNHGGR